MTSATGRPACCYCGDSFAAGEDALRDTSPLFPQWEAVRHELILPFHRVCWCWDRIDRWLLANAPNVYRELGGGATDAELSLTENLFNARIPLDVRRSYKVHDGSGRARLLGEGTLMSLKWMRDTVGWSGTPAGAAWDYVPLVTTGSGEYCEVDCRRDPEGAYGRFVWLLKHEVGRPKTVLAPDFGRYLESFADAVEMGLYREVLFSGIAALVPHDE